MSDNPEDRKAVYAAWRQRLAHKDKDDTNDEAKTRDKEPAWDDGELFSGADDPA